ncbi:MAG: UDP-3-O-acyl-N-acetylglucosamine deacetylase [Acidobacteriota bacterium]|nr:UDP-3-O-acyl-N-acetylglucosamine deacetylase [Acidobacteriota bacterium]
MDSGEVPILDGSSLPFAWALVGAGLKEQDVSRPTLVIHSSLSIEEEDRGLEIHPGRGLQLTAAIDFEHRHLGYQELTVRLDQQADFLAKLAPARTFALRRDIERLQEAGLSAAVRWTTRSSSTRTASRAARCAFPTNSSGTRCWTWWATWLCSAVPSKGASWPGGPDTDSMAAWWMPS